MMSRLKIPEAYYKEGKLIPKYFSNILYSILAEKSKPVEIGRLVDTAINIHGENTIEDVDRRLYILAKIEVSHFSVDEYPSFKLRSYTRPPDLSEISSGLRYLSVASRVLFAAGEFVDVREIVQIVEDKKLYRFGNIVPEYWMYLHLSAYSEFFLQRGALKIGLKEWREEKFLLKSKDRFIKNRLIPAQSVKMNTDVRLNIKEAIIENAVIEQLGKIEQGLQLIKSQFVCQGIGRIDILCKDKHGNLVVVELKKAGVRHDSIIGQITRYIVYVQKNVAKRNQKVRGLLLVSNADEKLRHSVEAIPNVEIKTYTL
jgi:hypothetical protein